MIQLFVKQVNHSDYAGKDTSRIFSNNSIFFFRITDPTTKKYSLLIYGGEDIADVKEALPDAFRIRKINKHFMPKQNKGFSSSLAAVTEQFRTTHNLVSTDLVQYSRIFSISIFMFYSFFFFFLFATVL